MYCLKSSFKKLLELLVWVPYVKAQRLWEHDPFPILRNTRISVFHPLFNFHLKILGQHILQNKKVSYAEANVSLLLPIQRKPKNLYVFHNFSYTIRWIPLHTQLNFNQPLSHVLCSYCIIQSAWSHHHRASLLRPPALTTLSSLVLFGEGRGPFPRAHSLK